MKRAKTVSGNISGDAGADVLNLSEGSVEINPFFASVEPALNSLSGGTSMTEIPTSAREREEKSKWTVRRRSAAVTSRLVLCL